MRDGRRSPAAFERASPVFDAVGALMLHLGPRGAGLAPKLARNLVGSVRMLGAQDGGALAAAAGTDDEQFATILEHTSALSSMMRDLLAEPDGDRVYAANLDALVELAAKDLRPALAVGADLGVALPAAELTLENVAFSLGADESPRP